MRPKGELLRAFEWHDLPVEAILIATDQIAVTVTPFDESTQDYRRVRLTLADLERVQFEITGTLTRKDLEALEIASFEILQEDDDRLSGQLGVLPRGAGYWTIGFSAGSWELVELSAIPC